MIMSVLIAPDNHMCKKHPNFIIKGLTKDVNQHISNCYLHDLALLNKQKAKSWLYIRGDKPIHKE